MAGSRPELTAGPCSNPRPLALDKGLFLMTILYFHFLLRHRGQGSAGAVGGISGSPLWGCAGRQAATEWRPHICFGLGDCQQVPRDQVGRSGPCLPSGPHNRSVPRVLVVLRRWPPPAPPAVPRAGPRPPSQGCLWEVTLLGWTTGPGALVGRRKPVSGSWSHGDPSTRASLAPWAWASASERTCRQEG